MTDETAQNTLMALDISVEVAVTLLGNIMPVTMVLPVADLQAMAKLWLMLPEIRKEMEDCFEMLDHSETIPALLDRLKALEGK